MSNECRCGRPTRDNRTICDQCQNDLHRALGDVGWITDELDVTITKQRGKATEGNGAASATCSCKDDDDRCQHALIPWRERAAEIRDTLRAQLVAWVKLCEEEQVRCATDVPFPADNMPAMSRWLMWRLQGIAIHELGPDMVEEITDTVANAERIIFWKPSSRVYLGTCGQRLTDDDGLIILERCPGEVYAPEESAAGECDECGHGVDVATRKAEMNKELDDRLCSPAELARLAVILGLDAPRDKVRKKINYWHRHARIVQHGTEPETEAPLFRYGEVRLMLYAEFARDTA